MEGGMHRQNQALPPDNIILNEVTAALNPSSSIPSLDIVESPPQTISLI